MSRRGVIVAIVDSGLDFRKAIFVGERPTP
jgi:hypothetical protein